MLTLTQSDHLDWRTVDRMVQTAAREIEAQDGEERVEQRAEHLARLAATPNGGKGQNADQIVDTALKALDLIGCLFHFHFHIRPLMGAACRASCLVRAASARIYPAERRTGSPGGCRR